MKVGLPILFFLSLLTNYIKAENQLSHFKKSSTFISSLDHLFLAHQQKEKNVNRIDSLIKKDSILSSNSSGDTIYCKDSKKIIGKIKDIETNYIAFILNGNEQEIILMPRSDVKSIHFENGFVENFSDFSFPVNNAQLYAQGLTDGLKFYNGKADFRKGILDGALTYLFYSGIVLLIIDYRKEPMIVSDFSDFERTKLLHNTEYRLGYLNSAKTIKRKKLIGGYFTGLIGLPIAFLAMMIALFAGG